MDLFIFDLLLHSCLPYDILCVILIFANECLISAEMQPDQVIILQITSSRKKLQSIYIKFSLAISRAQLKKEARELRIRKKCRMRKLFDVLSSLLKLRLNPFNSNKNKRSTWTLHGHADLHTDGVRRWRDRL